MALWVSTGMIHKVPVKPIMPVQNHIIPIIIIRSAFVIIIHLKSH